MGNDFPTRGEKNVQEATEWKWKMTFDPPCDRCRVIAPRYQSFPLLRERVHFIVNEGMGTPVLLCNKQKMKDKRKFLCNH